MPHEQSPDAARPIDGRWEAITCEGYTRTLVHVGRPCHPFIASSGQQERCQEDRGGDFYTACTQCMTCDVPHVEAPGLMAYVIHPEHSVGHCIFTRQPKTPEEIESAIDAMCASEVCGIRYGGEEPSILSRIAARGSATLGTTDVPLGGGTTSP